MQAIQSSATTAGGSELILTGLAQMTRFGTKPGFIFGLTVHHKAVPHPILGFGIQCTDGVAPTEGAQIEV